MKKIVGVIGSIIGFLIVSVIVNGISERNDPSSPRQVVPAGNKSLEDFLPEVVEEMKRKLPLPIQLDDYTVVYDVEAFGSQVIYRNRLIGIAASDARSVNLIGALAPEVRANACANEQMHLIFDLGASALYTYVDEAEEEVGSILVTPAQCEQLRASPSQPQ
jgi:hypothetical protein